MNKTRRMSQAVRLGKLLEQHPNVERTFEYVHVNRDGQDYQIKAVYPLLTKEAKRMTMAAYHLYIEAYNKKVNSERKRLKGLNKAIEASLEKSEQAKDITVRKQLHFLSCHGNSTVWQYNELVDRHNSRFGQEIPFKLPQTIKQSTEKIFSTLLWAYADQLLKLKNGKVKSKVNPYLREINTIEINTKHLENVKGDLGLFLLSCCPDTILNHKNRLIEAGVLVNNTYHSSQRGTMHHICPEIMILFDDFTGSFVYAENQLLNILKPEVFRDVFQPTRAISKPIVKRVVHNSIRKKRENAFLSKYDFPAEKTGADLPAVTGAPRIKQNIFDEQKNRGVSREKNHDLPENTQNLPENTQNLPEKNTVSPGSTSYLRSLLLLWNVFADKLSKKEFEKYTPIDYEVLKNEAMNGTMGRDEFRELLITELFKLFSKVYKNHPNFKIVFTGEWYMTIKLWLMSTKFLAGDGSPLSKDVALHQYRKYLYCLIDRSFGALPISRRSKFVAPRPTVYLNPDLVTPGTFMSHYKKVEKNSVNVITAENKIRSERIAIKNENLLYTNNLRKLNRVIADWHKSGSDFAKLLQYSANNMPASLHADLAKHVQNYFTNRNPKKYTA